MSTAPEPTIYSERLSPPLRWWLLGLGFLASIWVAVLVAMSARTATLVTLVGGVLMVAAFWGYGAARISIGASELTAGPARIPLPLLGEATSLDAAATRQRLGRLADARAFLLTRPYISRSVHIPVLDPADPTPYWLLSTRHPEQLIAALRPHRTLTTSSSDSLPGHRRGYDGANG